MAKKNSTTDNGKDKGWGDNVIPIDQARKLTLNVEPGESATAFLDFAAGMDAEEQHGFYGIGIQDALNRVKVLEHCVFTLTLLLAKLKGHPCTLERKRDLAKDLNIDLDGLLAEARARGVDLSL